MDELEQFVEQAIPHEAGHVLVGRITGVPVKGLDHIVVTGSTGALLPGNFATRTLAPTGRAAFDYAPLEVREAYREMVGGGLAGNLVSATSATEHGLEKDRYDLKMVSSETLEAVAERSRKIIDAHRSQFDDLCTTIKSKYEAFVHGPNLSIGRHQLVSSSELDRICPQNKTLFPPESFT